MSRVTGQPCQDHQGPELCEEGERDAVVSSHFAVTHSRGSLREERAIL